MTGRPVLITGITGQDGGYLAERLVAEGFEVHGLVHGGDATAPAFKVAHPGVILHPGDLGDEEGLRRLVAEVEPAELYNLAGISSVAFSWEHAVLTAQLSGVAPVVLFDAALRLQERTGRRVACVQASSAEIFGDAEVSPQDESTPIRPVSPYGAAKAYAHLMSKTYRTRGLHVASMILYNHESPRRPETFVTRKITMAAARIARDGRGTLVMGNLAAQRDWGWAPDYVDAMVRAARHVTPGDFVVATGQPHSVANFVEVAFRHAQVPGDWRDYVTVDKEFFRPADAGLMVGDATKIRRELGWRPTTDFSGIVAAMVDRDADLVRTGSVE